MYAEHVPAIANGMRSDPEIFMRGALFAVLSIRQPVHNVPAMLEDVDRTRSESAYLFGHKRGAYQYLILNRDALWRELCETPLEQPGDAIETLCRVPGLGIVKSGFVAQMLGFDVACLDGRNAQREGRKPRAWEITKRLSARAFRGHIDRYVDETGGRAQEYWDAWCDYVAPDYGLTGEAVSALHLSILPDDFVPF